MNGIWYTVQYQTGEVKFWVDFNSALKFYNDKIAAGDHDWGYPDELTNATGQFAW